MKRLFRIFELTKHEQRVVLIVMLVLIAIAFVGYECRLHRVGEQGQATVAPSPGATAHQ
jgi:hypothetical protein